MRPILAWIFVISGIASAIAIVHPMMHRATVRAALESAASDYCTCMIGTHTSEVRHALDGTYLAVRIAKLDDEWPKRCDALEKRAAEAARQADMIAIEGQAADLLETLQPFWTQPSDVERPPPPVFTRFSTEDRAFTDVSLRELSISVVRDRIVLQAPHGTCTIEPTDVASCTWEPPSLELLEREDGAPELAWNAGTNDIVRVSDRTKLIGFARGFAMRWGRAFANGRVVVVSDEGKILEHASGRILTGRTLPIGQRSTRFNHGWALWKDTSVSPEGGSRTSLRAKSFDGGEGDARVMAMNLADGAAAKPIVLGTTKRPGFHSYAACEAEAVFIDMDPNILAFDGKEWMMAPMGSSNHHLTCLGDHAFVTSGDRTSRCDRKGCVGIGFEPFVETGGLGLVGFDPEQVAATDDVAWKARRWGDFWMLDVAAVSSPKKTIPLASTSLGYPEIVMAAGRLVIVQHRVLDDRVTIASIDRTGAMKILSAD